METHPVLDVELAELAVSLHAAGGAGHLLHEGAQLHGLGDQGAAHGAVVGVRLGGEGEVVPGQVEGVSYGDARYLMADVEGLLYCVTLF